MAAETNRIASSYGLMNYFANYATHFPKETQLVKDSAVQLANSIYSYCGNSYTSDRAKYCPTVAYMTDNYRVNYESGRDSVTAYISFYRPVGEAQYAQSNIVKLSNIRCTASVVTNYAQSVTVGNSSVLTYSFSYDMFARGVANFETPGVATSSSTTTFTFSPACYGYQYSITGDNEGVRPYSITASSNSRVFKLFTNNIGGNYVTLKVWDPANPDANASRPFRFKPYNPTNVNWFNLSTSYIVLNDNSSKIYNAYALYSTFSTSLIYTPIPKELSVSIKYYDNIITYTDKVVGTELLTRTTASNSVSTSNGSPFTGSYIIVPMDITPTRADAITTSRMLVDYQPNRQKYAQVQLTSLAHTWASATTTRSLTKNLYFINDVKTFNFAAVHLQNTNTFWVDDSLGTIGSITVEIGPNDSFYKTVSLNFSSGNLSCSGSLPIISTPERMAVTFDVYQADIMVENNVTVSATLKKYDNTNITSTSNITVNVVFSECTEVPMFVHGIQDSVVVSHNNSNPPYTVFQNDASMLTFPVIWHYGNTLFRIKITYRYLDMYDIYEEADYINVVYQRNGNATRQYKLTFDYDSAVSGPVNSINVVAGEYNISFGNHFPEGVRVTNIEIVGANDEVPIAINGNIANELMEDVNNGLVRIWALWVQFNYYTDTYELHDGTSIEYITDCELGIDITPG